LTAGTPGRIHITLLFCLINCTARQAGKGAAVAVVFNNINTSPGLVQIIDILGYNTMKTSQTFQVAQPDMGGVRCRSKNYLFKLPEHTPYFSRIAAESFDACILAGVIARPQSAGAPEIRDTGIYGYTGTCKRECKLGVDNRPSGSFNEAVHQILLSK
jgi:hypothetical protein